MRLKLFNFAAAVSLLLCVATAALWGRSHVRSDYVRYRGPARSAELVSQRGLLIIVTYSWSLQYAWNGPGWHLGTLPQDVQYSRAVHSTWRYGVLSGLGLEAPSQKPGGVWDAGIPYWLPCLATAVPPLLWLRSQRRRRRRQRAARGLCPDCGYDVRATPGRCPECGAGVAAEPAA